MGRWDVVVNNYVRGCLEENLSVIIGYSDIFFDECQELIIMQIFNRKNKNRQNSSMKEILINRLP